MFFDFTIASLGFDFFQQNSFPDNWKKTHREQIRRWHVFFVVAGVCFGKLEALNLGLWSWNLWVFGTFLWWIQDGKHWSNNMVWRCLNNGGWKISGWQFFRLAVFQETSDLLVFFGGVCESESWNSCRFPGGRSNTSLYVTGRRHWKTLPLFEHVDFFSTWRYCMFFFSKKKHQHQMLIYQSSKESWYGKAWWIKSTKLGVQKSWFDKNHPLLFGRKVVGIGWGYFADPLDLDAAVFKRDVWCPVGSAFAALSWCFEDPPYL